MLADFNKNRRDMLALKSLKSQGINTDRESLKLLLAKSSESSSESSSVGVDSPIPLHETF